MINYLDFNNNFKKDMYDCFSSNVGDFYKQLSLVKNTKFFKNSCL